MRFIHFTPGCEPHQLSVEQCDTPKINDDEVLIEVKAAGVNRADTLQRQGKYPAPKGESEILGLEVAGVICQVGERVSKWHMGNNVFALVPGGGYSQYCKVKASHLMALPENFSFQQGAASAEVFLTAFQALFSLGQLSEGQTVLIHAGASGVGTAAIQLAKMAGAKVVVTASSEEKLAVAQSLGADLGINYSASDFVEGVKQFAPTGADLIIDFVAGEYTQRNIDCAAVDGKIVILAMLGGRYSQVDNAKLLAKRVQLIPSTLRSRSDEYKTQLVSDFIARFYMDLAMQNIAPVIDTEFDWREAGMAHQRLENNDSIGKFVLSVGD